VNGYDLLGMDDKVYKDYWGNPHPGWTQEDQNKNIALWSYYFHPSTGWGFGSGHEGPDDPTLYHVGDGGAPIEQQRQAWEQEDLYKQAVQFLWDRGYTINRGKVDGVASTFSVSDKNDTAVTSITTAAPGTGAFVNAAPNNTVGDSGAAGRQFQPIGNADPATVALLNQMNANQGFLGQVEAIAANSQLVVGNQKVMRNGVLETSPLKQEYGFSGYSFDGIVTYDLGLHHSMPYDRFGSARMTIENLTPPDSTPFIVHAHSFVNGSSGADWNTTNTGTYIFTVIPASNRVEVILPNGSAGYQGTISQVFPGLNAH
jgi:hypothetical protein